LWVRIFWDYDSFLPKQKNDVVLLVVVTMMRNPIRTGCCSLILLWSSTWNPWGNQLLSSTAVAAIPAFPRQRFIVFSELSNDASNAAIALGYEDELWNVPGTYPLEFYSYENAMTNASIANFQTNANVLGLNDSEVWDCWQNHYIDYDWIQLEQAGVQSHWITLGYTTESQWNDTSNFIPATEELFWAELTNEQQQAARQLCYMEGSWNELPLTLYDLSEFQTETPPPGDSNTNQTTSLAPTTVAPGTTFAPTPTAALEIVKPHVRYIPWLQLQDSIRQSAELVAYDADTWNEPGTAVIEELDWESIRVATPKSIPILQSMGLYGPTWDCYINHYGGFFWSELTPEVQQAYETLGWTETTWNSGAVVPVSETTPWIELSEAERAAAERVCYFDKLWDRIPLTEWGNSTKDETTPPSPDDGANQSGTTIAYCLSALVWMTWICMATLNH
jgi:hypothetical protein